MASIGGKSLYFTAVTWASGHRMEPSLYLLAERRVLLSSVKISPVRKHNKQWLQVESTKFSWMLVS